MANYNSFINSIMSEPTPNSFAPNTFSTLLDLEMSKSWTNKASVMMDPAATANGKITLNHNYLDRDKLVEEGEKSLAPSSITTPPGYLVAHIVIRKGGEDFKDIPILFPGTFSNSISASYATESPVGGIQPIIAFNNTDAESFPFSFVALSDYLPSGYTSLKSYLEALKEMVKPGYQKTATSNLVKAPTVWLFFADYAIHCVCKSISITYDEIYNNNSFVKANISCEFTKIDNEVYKK